MELSTLRAISPVDGRYAEKLAPLREIFSEFGLIRHRVLVEVRWLEFLAEEPGIDELSSPSSGVRERLSGLAERLTMEDADAVKSIEARTNHDVKAVEYFIGEQLGEGEEADRLRSFIHFACTSEDINNLAYALMVRTARDDILLPAMRELDGRLEGMADAHAGLAMLARTHGQPASPTTLGKELANVLARLRAQRESLESCVIRGKFNGAVGNFNAHRVAYPALDWPEIGARFVRTLELEPNSLTTQIEPHDWLAAFCHALSRYNTVLLDFCRDVWAYISIGYFRQRAHSDEVGSSTMPHKVNPIDFENAEGNVGIANALLEHFAAKLPVSRWQRDLTDSTVMRNLGVAIAHSLLAVDSCRRGLQKLEPDGGRIAADLDSAWEVLAEAVQTVMRRHGIEQPYEKLKALTRGRRIDRDALIGFIGSLDIPEAERERLLAMTPAAYTGFAEDLTRMR